MARANPTAGRAGSPTPPCGIGEKERISILESMKADPSLRYTESGRFAFRWLYAHVIGLVDCENVVDQLPSHWIDSVRHLALQCAAVWNGFAEELGRRQSDTE
jgi:hypothetical protein